MRTRRCWLAGVSALGLAGLSACAATGPSYSATRLDSQPAPGTAPAMPAPDSQAASPAVPPEPIVPPVVPPEPSSAPEPAPVPQKLPEEQPPPAAAVNQLPPCLPVHPKPHRKRKPYAKEPQGPESPSAAQTRTDTTVDAQVGQVGTSLTSILGKNVQDPRGEALGRVVDVLADANGRVRVAIIDFGGFLGVGTRRIAVDWPLLRFNPKASDKSLILSVTREKLQSAPEYKDSTSPRVLMPPPAASQDAADTGETEK
ncbi:MAG: PRC-barrel domain-containing protein [Steroidobacteraceae bacterium]